MHNYFLSFRVQWIQETGHGSYQYFIKVSVLDHSPSLLLESNSYLGDPTELYHVKQVKNTLGATKGPPRRT